MKTTGYIDENGHYIRGEEKSLGFDVNPTHKQWRHEYERKKFAKEIIQPYKYGKPNREFLEAYPEESKEFFSKDTIEKLRRQV